MNISKKILVTSLVIAGALSSCTKGFDEINAPENTFTKSSSVVITMRSQLPSPSSSR